MTSPTFSILFVCTGNICRSPLAEIVTRRLLDERLGVSGAAFTVASAGTRAVTGNSMAVGSRRALSALGATEAARSFRARRLDAGMAASADLVLTAERGHRQLVVTLQPTALAKTFCFREFVRLLAGIERRDLPADPVHHARAAMAAAGRRRGMDGLVRADADALPDPIAHTPSVHQRSVELIAATAGRLVVLLTPLARRTETAPAVEGVTA
jgi:protein-tyrosine phosphatase